MRKPSRISPSSLAKFEKDREDFFFTYCAEPKPPREPQSKPASVGSAFDAYVKSQLISDLFGTPCFSELFEKQVEHHNRDFALGAGRHVMESYVESGAYADLMELLDGAEQAEFEFDAGTELDGIPIIGKPDCRFVHRDGAHIILDWKVNGYCGKGAVSPSKGYMLCRDGAGWDKPSRSHGKSHKLFEPTEFLGLTVNKFFMEQVSIDWADQLTMYAWMMGEPVGSDKMIVCIDQIVGKGAGKRGLEDGPPKLRVAHHRCRVSKEHQLALVERLNVMWDALRDEHIFTHLTKEENDIRMEGLGKRALSLLTNGTPEGDFFAMCARPDTFYRSR